MRGAIEKYGLYALTVLMITIVLGGVFGSGLYTWYQSTFDYIFDGDNTSPAIEDGKYPIINSPEVVYVLKGSVPIDFTVYSIVAYSDSTASTQVPVEILGTSGINYNTCGFYNIELVARNAQNKVFSKTMVVTVRDY